MSNEFILLGDAIWLDFVNTARGRHPSPTDLLGHPAAYARWARTRQLDPASDELPFAAVARFRAELTELAEALTSGQQPPSTVVASVNRHLARSTGCRQLTRVGGEWRLRFAPDQPLTALGAVARSAAATLADPVVRIRRCAGEQCTLFIADDSATQSRRWCDAGICGRGVWIERRRGILR